MLRGIVAHALFVACASPQQPPPSEQAMTSQPARIGGIVIEPRMLRHADQLADLRAAVYDVDFARAGAAARIILAEPPVVPPSENDSLSARYAALEKRMFDATRVVEAAADSCDRDALSHAFETLTTTCRACHTLYEQSRAATRNP